MDKKKDREDDPGSKRDVKSDDFEEQALVVPESGDRRGKSPGGSEADSNNSEDWEDVGSGEVIVGKGDDVGASPKLRDEDEAIGDSPRSDETSGKEVSAPKKDAPSETPTPSPDHVEIDSIRNDSAVEQPGAKVADASVEATPIGDTPKDDESNLLPAEEASFTNHAFRSDEIPATPGVPKEEDVVTATRTSEVEGDQKPYDVEAAISEIIKAAIEQQKSNKPENSLNRNSKGAESYSASIVPQTGGSIPSLDSDDESPEETEDKNVSIPEVEKKPEEETINKQTVIPVLTSEGNHASDEYSGGSDVDGIESVGRKRTSLRQIKVSFEVIQILELMIIEKAILAPTP